MACVFIIEIERVFLDNCFFAYSDPDPILAAVSNSERKISLCIPIVIEYCLIEQAWSITLCSITVIANYGRFCVDDLDLSMFQARWKKVVVLWNLWCVCCWNVLDAVINVMNCHTWMKRLFLESIEWQFEFFLCANMKFWNIAFLYKINFLAFRVHNTRDNVAFLKLERSYLTVQFWSLMSPRTSVCAYHKGPMVNVVRIKCELIFFCDFFERNAYCNPVDCQFAYLESENLALAVHVDLRLHESRHINTVATRYDFCTVFHFDLMVAKCLWKVEKWNFPQILCTWCGFRDEIRTLGQDISHIIDFDFNKIRNFLVRLRNKSFEGILIVFNRL